MSSKKICDTNIKFSRRMKIYFYLRQSKSLSTILMEFLQNKSHSFNQLTASNLLYILVSQIGNSPAACSFSAVSSSSTDRMTSWNNLRLYNSTLENIIASTMTIVQRMLSTTLFNGPATKIIS